LVKKNLLENNLSHMSTNDPEKQKEYYRRYKEKHGYDSVKRREKYLKLKESGKPLFNPETRAAWWEDNKASMAEKAKVKREAMDEKERKAQRAEWYLGRIDKNLEYAKNYRNKNRAKIREYERAFYATHPEARIAKSIRIRVWHSLNRGEKTARKSGKTFDLVGCSIDGLRSYLEARFKPGMTWENWGKGVGKWHIDHVKPLAGFDLTSVEQQKEAFHFTNLQPLWSEENWTKGDRDPSEVPSLYCYPQPCP
jgi:hypothetical protein